MTDLDLDALRAQTIRCRDTIFDGNAYDYFVAILAALDEVQRLHKENIELRHQRDSVTDYLDSIMPTREHEEHMQADIPHNPHR